MAKPLAEVPQKKLNPILQALLDAGATLEHAAWIRQPYNAALMVAYIEDKIRDGVPSEFYADVTYSQPFYRKLMGRFRHSVNPRFQGRTFTAIDRCASLGREMRCILLEYVHLGCKATTDKVLAEMDRRGLRPALYEELLAFADAYPGEQRKHRIIALGSVTNIDGHDVVACLSNGKWHGHALDLHWFDTGCKWRTGDWFLAVRKGA